MCHLRLFSILALDEWYALIMFNFNIVIFFQNWFLKPLAQSPTRPVRPQGFGIGALEGEQFPQ